MNKRRLLKLADLLEENAKNRKGMRFDLDTVLGSSSEAHDFKPGVDCGTTGCAMGLAAVSGAFKRAGLSYRVDDNDPLYVRITLDGDTVDYVDAAAHIFDIPDFDAYRLFLPGDYSGPITGAKGERAVARRIRAYVEHDGAMPDGF